mgnify:CR=1 FL=1
MKWVKFKARKLTEEELSKPEYMYYEFMWDCQAPEVDETVLVSDGKSIWTEDWVEYDEGLCLEDSITEGLYWMPLPELPKEVTNE